MHDFVGQEIIDSVLSDVSDLEDSSWMLDAGSLNSESFWINRTVPPDKFSDKTRTLMDELNKSVTDCFDYYKEIIEVGNLHRTLPDGRSLDYHIDNYDGPDLENVFGIVIYLNEDYEGGQIHYKDLDIFYKPKAGDLIVHYAGLLHGVTEVSSGIRYIFTMFVRGSDKTTFMGEIADLSVL